MGNKNCVFDVANSLNFSYELNLHKLLPGFKPMTVRSNPGMTNLVYWSISRWKIIETLCYKKKLESKWGFSTFFRGEEVDQENAWVGYQLFVENKCVRVCEKEVKVGVIGCVCACTCVCRCVSVSVREWVYWHMYEAQRSNEREREREWLRFFWG